MAAFRKILVAVRNPRARRSVVVERAATLAAGSGARLELFHDLATPIYVDAVVGTGKTLSTITQAARAAALERLERLAAPLRARGLKVTTAAVWDYPPYEALVRRALAIKADLIVAHRRGHHRLPAMLGYTDWELLRASPVPVLLIRSARYRPRRPVLAAIDPMPLSAVPASLEKQILKNAAALAAAQHSPLHAVQVLAPWTLAGKVSPRVQLAGFTRAAGIKPSRAHVLEGNPDAVLPATARRLRAGVVVMGTLSRRGLKRWFVGNSAERLLDDLPCDVLAVKPAHFAMRLPRARRGVYFLSSMPLA